MKLILKGEFVEDRLLEEIEGKNGLCLFRQKKLKKRDELAVRLAWPSKDEEEVKTFLHTYISLLVGNQLGEDMTKKEMKSRMSKRTQRIVGAR